MKAITVRQPWAWLIAAGHKTVENRSFRPRSLGKNEPLAIHAGLKIDPKGYVAARERGITLPDAFAFGCIVATCRVQRIVVTEDELVAVARPWFIGPYGWVLVDVQPLEHGTIVTGKLGLWTLPDTATLGMVEGHHP